MFVFLSLLCRKITTQLCFHDLQHHLQVMNRNASSVGSRQNYRSEVRSKLGFLRTSASGFYHFSSYRLAFEMFVYSEGFLVCFLNSENNLEAEVHIFIKTNP